MVQKRGFTLIEVVVVLMVGAVLTSMAIVPLGGVRSRFAVQEATRSFAALHARTRAQAIEFGQTVELHLDAGGDSVWIVRNGATLETLRLGNELGVDLAATSSPATLCINSRGYGETGCSSFTTVQSLRFANAKDTASVDVFPLGQLRF